MLEYPQIPASTGTAFREFKAHVFDKLDGTNLRWEWSKKRGWYKGGTRWRRFDDSDREFGPAIYTFHETLAEPLAKIATDNRWQNLIVFTEWWGKHSLGGVHDPTELKHLTVFDASIDRETLMPPRDFLRFITSQVKTARYLGQMNWTRGFIEQVYRGEIEGVTSEGVIGKANVRGETIMAKAKTKAWIDAIKARYPAVEAEKLIAS